MEYAPKIQFQRIAIENFTHNSEYFDLIISSVTLHYVEDYNTIVKNIHCWLKNDGYLIFSVEHPICTAYPNAEIMTDSSGEKFHPVYNYRDEKAFYQKWFVENVRKFHKKISTYINILIEAGFRIEKILEPQPTDELINEIPKFSIHKIRPPLLVIKAKKTN